MKTCETCKWYKPRKCVKCGQHDYEVGNCRHMRVNAMLVHAHYTTTCRYHKRKQATP